MTLDDVQKPEDVEVWPCCVAAVDVFCAMQTQWRVGMAGATGFDYGALAHVMSLIGIARPDRRDVFLDLQVMEVEALNVMRK